MKILKIFKKPVFLVTLVVLAAILSVSVIAAAGTGSDFGGTVIKYQVGLQGKVNLKLTLDDATNGGAMADEDYYEVAVDGRDEAIQYPVSEIRETNVILVKLAPTEMNKTVTVTAKKADGTSGKVQTFSVKGYADAVLASTSNADYHDAMRALLNWGAKSEAYFTTPGNTADGLFSRGTDPISAVGTDTIGFTTHDPMSITGSRFVQDGSQLNLFLDEGDVSLVFKFKSTTGDEASLNATITRNDWNEAKAVKAVKDGDHYVVQIDGISTLLFNKTYTVTVTDGANSVTATSSVLEYLDKIVEGNTTTEQKNVAKSLYQLYRLTAAKPNTEACAHNAVLRNESENYFWIPAGEGETGSYIKCSHCFKQFGTKAVGDNVSRYVPAELLKTCNNQYNLINRTIVTDGSNTNPYYSFERGTQHATAMQFIWTRENNEKYTFEVGESNYLIVRMRVHSNATTVTLSLSTTDAENGSVKIPITSSGTDWATYVIDLERVFGDKYKKNTYGVYDVDRFYFHIDNANANEDSKVDMEYLAFVQTDAKGLSSIVDEEQVRVVTDASGANALYDTKDNQCIEHDWAYGSTTNGVGSKTYALTCRACGQDRGGSITVPTSVNFFCELSEFVYHQNGTKYKYQYDEEAGVVYNRVVTTDSAFIYFTGGETANTEAIDVGNYLVIKYRHMEPTGTPQIYVGTESSKTTNIGNANTGTFDGKWHVAVINLQAAKDAGNLPTDGNSTLYIKLSHWGAGTMDVAYVATVDDFEELRELVNNDTSFNYHGTSFANAPTAYSVTKCESDHGEVTPELITSTDGSKSYTYRCTTCGATLDTVTVPADVNFFGDLGMMNIFAGNNTAIKKYQYDADNKVVYNKITYESGTFINITGGTDTGTATTGTYSPGRYFVLKYRVTVPTTVIIAAGSAKADGKFGSLGQSRVTTTEWQIAVIDMKALIDAGTYPSSDSTLFFRLNTYGSEVHVAYSATVDDFEELRELVKNDTSFNYYGTSFANAPTAYSVTKCESGHGEVTPELITSTDGSKSYTYRCTTCGAALDTVTVPGGVNFFGTLDMTTIFKNGNAELKKYQYDATNGVVYNSVTMTDVWQTHINITGGAGNTGTTLSGNFPVGKYLVIKYRLATGSHLTLAAIGSVKDTSTGSLGKKESGSGEWEVAVIDMSDILDKFTTAESIYMRFDGKNVDIAYTAIVDSFDELKGLVTDETFNYYGKSFANTPDVYDTQTAVEPAAN